MLFLEHDNFIIDKFEWLVYNQDNSKGNFLKQICYLYAMTNEVKR